MIRVNVIEFHPSTFGRVGGSIVADGLLHHFALPVRLWEGSHGSFPSSVDGVSGRVELDRDFKNSELKTNHTFWCFRIGTYRLMGGLAAQLLLLEPLSSGHNHFRLAEVAYISVSRKRRFHCT